MNHQEKETETPRRRGRRALAAAGLLCLVGAAATVYNSDDGPLPSMIGPSGPLDAEGISSISDSILSSAGRRSLSVALPDGGCRVTYAHPTDHPIPPVWQASFPGSGSRMTWSLVEALTGIRTNDDYDSHDRGYENVVAVKTHYPIKNAKGRFEELDKLFNRAMVIFRNPIDAIPSYFNLQYEHLNHLPNHSTRGPNEDWIKYREHEGYGVMAQISNFERFATYWMTRYPDRHEQLFIAAYEDLTNDYMGPLVSMRIAEYLGRTEGVDPIDPASVPCVWQTIVNYKNQLPPTEDDVEEIGRKRKLKGNDKAGSVLKAEAEANDISRGAKENGRRKLGLLGHKTHAEPNSLRTGPKVRPYTEEHLSAMVAMFERLIEQFHFDEEFVRIMSRYIETVRNTEPLE